LLEFVNQLCAVVGNTTVTHVLLFFTLSQFLTAESWVDQSVMATSPPAQKLGVRSHPDASRGNVKRSLETYTVADSWTKLLYATVIMLL